MTRLSPLFVILFATILGVQHVKADQFDAELALISIGFLMQDTISAISNTLDVPNQYLTNAVTSASDGVMSMIGQIYLIQQIDPLTLPTDSRFAVLLNDIYALYTVLAVYVSYVPDGLALELAAGNLVYGINLLADLHVPFNEVPSSFNPTSEDEAYVNSLILISRIFITLASIEPTVKEFPDVVKALKVGIKYATDPGSLTTQDSGAPTIQSTFVLVKSDGVARELTGSVINRLNAQGLQMIGMKFVWMTQNFLDQYMDMSTPLPFYAEMALLGPGPGVAMVWQGLGAVNAVLSLIGSSDPDVVDPGTIRGDFGITEGKTIVHSSLTANDAQHEISMWFNVTELVTWTATDFI